MKLPGSKHPDPFPQEVTPSVGSESDQENPSSPLERVPEINLLHHEDQGPELESKQSLHSQEVTLEDVPEPEKPQIPQPKEPPVPEPAPPQAQTLHVEADLTLPELPAPHRRIKRSWILIASLAVLLLAGGSVGGYYLLRGDSKSAKLPVAADSKPAEQPTTTTTPATTTPTPAAQTPAPETVTAPTTKPTASSPQTVTVRAPHGLWFRSSATSASRSNIIDWMPDGAQISVDQTGDFWWHGTYKGKAGYFASTYTQ